MGKLNILLSSDPVQLFQIFQAIDKHSQTRLHVRHLWIERYIEIFVEQEQERKIGIESLMLYLIKKETVSQGNTIPSPSTLIQFSSAPSQLSFLFVKLDFQIEVKNVIIEIHTMVVYIMHHCICMNDQLIPGVLVHRFSSCLVG